MKKENKYYCDDCGDLLDEETDYIQQPDPYSEEILGDDTLKDLCTSCFNISNMEI